MSINSLLIFDEKIRQGRLVVAGADEAGRGPLAGPLVAAAVILPPGLDLQGIDDSKKLNAEKRQAAFQIICQHALAFSYCEISAAQVDLLNPLGASLLAMSQAASQLKIRPDLLLVDGNKKPQSTIPVECVVKGDSKSLSIAAASIVAKVIRDNLMLEAHQKWPQYGFQKHKGYGTKEHLAALAQYGPAPCHRLSYRGVKGHAESQQAFDFAEPL